MRLDNAPEYNFLLADCTISGRGVGIGIPKTTPKNKAATRFVLTVVPIPSPVLITVKLQGPSGISEYD